MSWPEHTPEAIAERIATRLEAKFPGLDARSGKTFASILTIAQAMEIFDVHLFQALLRREAFPDTAVLTLEWHADTWGIERVAATHAVGPLAVIFDAPTTVPEGTSFLRGNVLYLTTAAVTVGVAGTASLPLRCEVAGTIGNVPTGTALTLVSPIAGVTGQGGTVAAPGLASGAEEEELEPLRSRLLAHIRRRPMGGRRDDYEAWARKASSEVGKVRVVGKWAGKGSVGVIVAMAGPRTPTGGELAMLEAAVQAERPVTADLIMVPAVPLAVPFQILLQPDTSATRAAVISAIDAYLAAEAEIAGVLPRSRISEAISAAAGEYSHTLLQPAAAVVPGAAQIPVRGAVSWA